MEAKDPGPGRQRVNGRSQQRTNVMGQGLGSSQCVGGEVSQSLGLLRSKAEGGGSGACTEAGCVFMSREHRRTRDSAVVKGQSRRVRAQAPRELCQTSVRQGSAWQRERSRAGAGTSQGLGGRLSLAPGRVASGQRF